MERERGMTVGQLIEQLNRFPRDAVVGVRASCCSHAHHVNQVVDREEGYPSVSGWQEEAAWEDDTPVIIDARA